MPVFPCNRRAAQIVNARSVLWEKVSGLRRFIGEALTRYLLGRAQLHDIALLMSHPAAVRRVPEWAIRQGSLQRPRSNHGGTAIGRIVVSQGGNETARLPYTGDLECGLVSRAAGTCVRRLVTCWRSASELRLRMRDVSGEPLSGRAILGDSFAGGCEMAKTDGLI